VPGEVRAHRLDIGIAALLLALGGRAAAAETEDQRSQTALKACASGEVPRGIALLAELYAEDRDPTHVFNQGRCYQQNGKTGQALERFREYLRVGAHEPPQDIKRAQGFIKELEDAEARRRAEEAASPADKRAAAARAAADERRRSLLRTTAISLGAAGAASLATGVVLGLKVNALEHSVEKEFGNDAIVADPARLKRRLADGGRYETWQWIAYGAGVAAIAGGVTALAFAGGLSSAPRERAAVAVAPLALAGGAGGLLEVRF
jgi:hypothetical protein